ncbi:helix-turn-helix transcriptional regulator [Phascolarctobacterium sp.]|uniref:helix-turn-helix transcriptional regulator n=1 Tax=Phascolarctobacterium sp. TaxID=2049039 RepID=UPI00386D95BB
MQIWKSKVIDELWGVQVTTEEKLINSCDWDEIKEWLALEGGKGLSIDVNDARLRIAYAIKKARIERDFTQFQLGSYVGLPQTRISEMETGKLDIRLKNLLKVLEVLGMTIEIVPLKNK